MLKEKLYSLFAKKTELLFLTSVLCATILGFFSGLVFTSYAGAKKTLPAFVQDINPKVPFLEVLAVEDDTLFLRTKETSVRFQVGDSIMESAPQMVFKIHYDPVALLKSFEATQVKEIKELNTACNYLASKTGKIAYPKSEPKGQKLKSPRCFTDEEAAMEAGLTIYEN